MEIRVRKACDREQMREKILEAARELFSRAGYDAVTMRQIAKQIGYTATTLYSYFQDKEDLFRALCEVDFRTLRAAFAEIAAIADPIERLRQAGRAYLHFALDHPGHYRWMFMTPKPAQPDAVQIERGNPDQDSYAFVRSTIREAAAGGRFRPDCADAELLAQVLWGGLHGVIALHMTHENDPWIDWRPVQQRAELVIDALIRGFCPA